MNDRLNNRLRRRIENFICDDKPEDINIIENQIYTAINGALKWLYRNVLPVCCIALIINLTIMFTLPVEVAMSGWFWVKDPLSIILAFILVKAIN